MIRPLLSLTFLVISFSFTIAATIRGFVFDSKTGEPLVGATVLLKDTKFGTSAGLDGSYEIKNVPAGSYVIVSQLVGYLAVEKSIVVKDTQDVIKNDLLISENVNQLSEVVVTGIGEQESEQSTRRSEQRADNVLNIIGAKAIQLLPDLTVGNILQRVSGVSIVRNSSGDGQYAIIRGMDKRYNYTLVNGIKIPSPDNKNRYVPLDIFPADLLERLEVIKALTPSMEGDAIGGAMNMIMKSAPPTLTISATLAGGVSNVFSASRPFAGFSSSNLPLQSPETMYGPNYQAKISDFKVNQLQYTNTNLPVNSLMSFSIGNRVLNDKLGFIVAASYQNIFRGTNSIFYKPGEPSPRPTPNNYQFDEVQIRQFSNLQNRLGLHGKLDYAINRSNKISLYNLFVKLDEAQHRNYYNPLGSGSGLATNDVRDRSRFTTQTIYSSTLKGEHNLTDKLRLDWTLAYSIAKSNTPAWADMNVRYRYNNGVLVTRELLPVTQQWTNNNDNDKSGYLNLTYVYKPNLEFAAGGLARFKTRDNVHVDYELNTLLSDGTGNFQAFTTIDKAIFTFLPATNAYANPNDPNNYSAKENIIAAYVQGKYTIANRLQIIGGVRNENTAQEYHSQLTIYKPGRDGNITYSDLLPSVNMKYSLSQKQNLRLSYYKAISRPNYFEFVPTELSGDNWTEAGNYDIKHSTADNYDFRYEFFDKGNDQLLAGIFYKKIMNPIEYGFEAVTVSSANLKPFNFGTATNYGFELVVAKYIKNFGITANYTYTNSSITTTKKRIYQVSPTESAKINVDQTRPLQGQSNHIGNVSFIYKNATLGFDAQLAYVFTGRRINFVSPYEGLDYWQRDFSQVDFSAEKKIFKHFQVFIKVTNLLDAPLIVEVMNPNYLASDSPAQDRSDRIVVQKDDFHQTFLTGLRFKF